FIADESMMASAFGGMWAGLQSTVIRSIDMDIVCENGIVLSSIQGDGQQVKSSLPNVSRITLPDMQADERKHILLHFSLPASASRLCTLRPRIRHRSSDQYMTLSVAQLDRSPFVSPAAASPAAVSPSAVSPVAASPAAVSSPDAASPAASPALLPSPEV